jgi:hypothetical protein
VEARGFYSELGRGAFEVMILRIARLEGEKVKNMKIKAGKEAWLHGYFALYD